MKQERGKDGIQEKDLTEKSHKRKSKGKVCEGDHGRDKLARGLKREMSKGKKNKINRNW